MKFVPHYKNVFYGKEHMNYMCLGDEITGPVIASVEKDNSKARVKALIRTKRGDERAIIENHNIKNALASLPQISSVKLIKVESAELPSKLLEYETRLMEGRYKFGVLYCKADQTTEDQWYNNVEGSTDLDEFMSFLADKIQLQGWSKYTGGLNTKDNFTGTHSYYICYQNHEIMFHVSTYLPYFPDDLQQVERKRHLGNDVVLVVFRDEKCVEPFNPLLIRSQFNHIFCVVQPDRSSGHLQYKIAFAAKLGVNPFGPGYSAPGIFDKTPELKNFILTKLINGERSAMQAPDFKGKNTNTRKTLLTRIIQETSSS